MASGFDGRSDFDSVDSKGMADEIVMKDAVLESIVGIYYILVS